MQQSNDRTDPLFIVSFYCQISIAGAEPNETQRHELGNCIIRAKGQEHAQKWGEELRYRFLNEDPNTGPEISEDDQVGVEVEAFTTFVENLYKNGLKLEKG